MDHDLLRQLESGATLVTPNRRLARDLARRFNLVQIGTGRSAWPSADVLPWSAWLERTLGEAARDDPRLRLLGPAQELALWQRLIEPSHAGSPLLDAAAAARSASAARRLQLAWRIDLRPAAGGLPQDARTWLAWARGFEAACREGAWLEPARVPDALAVRVRAGGARLPPLLILYGFEPLSPQEQVLLEALRAAGTRVAVRDADLVEGSVRRAPYLTAEEEWAQVARRARALLEADAAQRIGVVVPELSLRRDTVLRIFDETLDPGRLLPGASRRSAACNVSLGVPLSAYPLVHTALAVLRLAHGRLALTEAGALLRSPFLAAAEHEFLRRALLDAQLRRLGRLEVEPADVLELARGRSPDDPSACPQLAQRLAAWIPRAQEAQTLRQPPSAWSATFLSLLAGLGWPGERTIDSDEYQTWDKFRDTVAGLAHLDGVLDRLRYPQALAWLARLTADTLFQPESEEVPVQILGALESVGLQFDHLFVTGLHDEAWPQPARPNPFLPVAVQRAHGVPHASAEWELGFAHRMTALWRGGAPQVILSYPTREGDRTLRPSPLLAGLAAAQDAPAASRAYAQRIREHGRLERISDAVAPPLRAGLDAPATVEVPAAVDVLGGAAVLQDQAACPFRAFAVHRLGARALEEGHPGLDARERGTLLHRALALLWGELRSQRRLLSLSEERLLDVVSSAVDGAIASIARRRPDAFGVAFTELERARLRRLLLALLELERRRAPFEVVAREEPRTLELGGLRLQARVDRIDALDDGRRVILDYKTGKAGTGEWDGDRPDSPQLPLYAVTDAGDLAALAFVVLRAEEIAFKGLGAEAGLLPGVEPLERPQTWGARLTQWRDVLKALAAQFVAGHAPVAPKRYPHTCEYCALGALCRVKELFDPGPVSVEQEPMPLEQEPVPLEQEPISQEPISGEPDRDD
ncbi:MAG TPA: PD-(D/E)XK nuclease family protein [Burkholderiales bacterium]|nr:PD-(D/E)XK nuclease family protein [Burkholderiales bacterium]